MNKKIKIFLNVLLLNTLLLSYLKAQVKNDTLIFWHKTQKLGWIDFQGKVPSDSGTDKARSGLKINTNFFYRENLLDAKVLCAFVKNKSWVKDTSTSLLKHEQLHFDISELYARKIRKGVSILRNDKKSNVEDYTKLVNCLLKKDLDYNTQYDKETEHSLNKLKQVEWEHRIAKELEEFKDYEVDYSNQIK